MSSVIKRYDLVDASGFTLGLTNAGASLMSCSVPFPGGKKREICLGLREPSGYMEAFFLDRGLYLGASVGRYANRIEQGRFSLDGRTHRLSQNEGDHHLHGGLVGLDREVWEVISCDDRTVVFATSLEEGQDGYPGRFFIEAEFTLFGRFGFEVTYRYRADQDSIAAPTLHGYFNLNGFEEDVTNHRLYFSSVQRLIKNEKGICSGEAINLNDTVISLRDGWDDYLLTGEKGDFHHQVRIEVEDLKCDIWSDCPGAQLYVPKTLICDAGFSLPVPREYPSFCFESQECPNGPNFLPKRGVIRAGQEYVAKTRYVFEVL